MQVRTLDGASVFECGLCGAQFGDSRAMRRLQDAEEATRAGVDEEVWPLVRALSRLPGLRVGSSSGGSVERHTLPSVELLVTGAAALGQLENLAKALRLMQGGLRCLWQCTVHYERALTFVLTATGSASNLRDARIDLEAIARQLERDMRLSWWRHAPADAADGRTG